jgi:hypothetical protein
LPVRAAYLDGKSPSSAPIRVSSFAELQYALSRGRAERLTYQSSI